MSHLSRSFSLVFAPIPGTDKHLIFYTLSFLLPPPALLHMVVELLALIPFLARLEAWSFLGDLLLLDNGVLYVFPVITLLLAMTINIFTVMMQVIVACSRVSRVTLDRRAFWGGWYSGRHSSSSFSV